MYRKGRKAFTVALVVALLLVVIPAWAISRSAVTADIALSPSETIQIERGGKATVKAVVTPVDSAQGVKWSSSDRKIATVKDGVITARANGTATVSAISGDREATVEVVVVPKTVETTQITLSQKTVKLVVGGRKTVEATVAPWDSTQPVEWSSSDEKVATVLDGVITGKAVGKATITAQSGTRRAEVLVAVARKTVKTTKIALSPSKTIKLAVGDRKTVKVAVKPKNSTQAVKWASSDKKVATVSKKGVVTAKGEGTAIITAKSGSKSAKVKVKVNSPAPSEPAATQVPNPTATESNG